MTEKLRFNKFGQQDTRSNQEENPVVEKGKENDFIREEMNIYIRKEKKNYSICEICICKQPFIENAAVFLCFVCEVYICASCKIDHQLHDGMGVGSEENERRGEECKGGGMGEDLEALRKLSENSERDEMRRKFLDEIMSESLIERVDKFDSKYVRISDRVNVKDVRDENDCWITGLCGLSNTGWVVCDYNNNCLKLFKLGNNALQRYIQFESQPYGVTEVQNSNEPDLVSGCKSVVSITNKSGPDKQCLIAVTLPWKHQIIFTDLTKRPALKEKIVSTEKQCYCLQFCDAKLFILCLESPYYISSFYIYLKSLDGTTLYILNTDIYFGSVPQLAVISGIVYITDSNNHTIHCSNIESKLSSEITIKGSGAVGISVTPNNEVYVSAKYHNKVYYLDSNLTLHYSVLDHTKSHIQEPNTMCYHQGKLYISHFESSSVCNFVTVVSLT